MASILIAAGVLSYDAIKKQNTKRKTRKAQQTTSFSALERENAARISHLQSTTCFCQRSDWRGGGCEAHGYVPAAGEPGGPPLYMEHAIPEDTPAYEEGFAPRAERRRTMPPEYQDPNSPHAPASAAQTRNSPYQYRRGQEDGFFASQPVGARAVSHSAIDLSEGWRAPPAMGGEEVRRINEERRRRMKSGGFTNFVLRWKRDRSAKGGGGMGDGVVR